MFSALFAFYLFGLVHIITAHPTLQAPATILYSRATQECTFTGNPDLYGPGIRVGIYTQTLAVFLAKNLVLSQAHVVRDSLTVFSATLLIVSIRFAADNSSVNAVEYFLLLQILSWNLITGVRSRSSYTMSVLRNRTVRTLSAEAVNIAAVGLHAWFWFKGLDRFEGGEPDAVCKAKVFFFTKTDMRGFFRVLMQYGTVMTFLEHLYDLSGRAVGAIGKAWWKEKEEDMKRAVQEFDTWKKEKMERDMRLGCCNKKGCVAAEKEVLRTSGSTVDINLQNMDSSDKASIHTVNTRSSTHTSADGESISDKINRIKSQLPDQETTPTPVVATASSPTTTPPPIPLFTALLASDSFLALCAAASTPATAAFRAAHPKLYRLIQLAASVPCPQDHSLPTPLDTPKTPSWKQCMRALFRAALARRLPRQVVTLATHLFYQRTLDPVNGPHQLYAALTHAALPPRHVLQLAADIQFSQRPPMNAYIRYKQAGIDLMFHLFIMTQLEMTIRYNKITGLSGIANVGQLIPLLVGTGGFLMVAARGVEGVWKGERVWEDNGEGRVDAGGRAFMEAYEEWKGLVGEGGDGREERGEQGDV